MKAEEFVEMMRGFEADHEPDGWPAIQMKDISRLCDIIERQCEALKECNHALYFCKVIITDYTDPGYAATAHKKAKQALDREV